MKLTTILNENNEMVDTIEDYLQNETFSPELEQALENIPDSAWIKLCQHPLIVAAAKDSYDYADDTGSTISIDEETILNALEDVVGW
jgi:hypothetical protein